MKFELIAAALLIGQCAFAQQTTVRFQPSDPDIGPFPTNVLATSDPLQKTGVRISLQRPPGCVYVPNTGVPPGVCEGVTGLLNQLDGFSVNPQLKICFTGTVNPATLRDGISFVPVQAGAAPVAINQIFFDPATSCVLAKPERVLDQSSRYVLAVTNRVKNAAGVPVAAGMEFAACAGGKSDGECAGVAEALPVLARNSIPVAQVAAATVFSTLSATDWLVKARQTLQTMAIPALAPPFSAVTTVDVAKLRSWEWVPDTDITRPPGNPQALPIDTALYGIDQISFGVVLSPNYLLQSGPFAGSIPAQQTGLSTIGQPIALGYTDPRLPAGYGAISYHVFLPQGLKKNEKVPVVLYGHGFADSQFGAPTYIAAVLAQAGYATLAFEEVGHGHGLRGTVNLTDNKGTTTVLTPGRGVPVRYVNADGTVSGDGSITQVDGCLAFGPLATRDCARQTAVDVMAIVRAIKSNGLGVNLDGTRISYIGQSFGSIVGSLVNAVEPDIKMAVLNGAGDSVVDIARLSYGDHKLAGGFLALYNFPNYFALLQSGSLVPPGFDFFYTYRSTVVSGPPPFPGAATVKTAFEIADWLNIPGAPLAFAPYFQQKPTLFQFGFGDLEVPNPTESALVRASLPANQNLDASLPVSFFRFDRAWNSFPHLASIFMPGYGYSILPHRLLANPTIIKSANGDELVFSVAQQIEAVTFLRTGGAVLTAGPWNPYFQALTLRTLPNDRNYNPLAIKNAPPVP